MKNKSLFSSKTRKRKAYYTAFVVFFSYMILRFKRKLFGQQYYEKRIKKLHLRNAQKIKARIQELQGLFIKFGQLISNLSNILPEEFRSPLEELQDHVNPKPYSEIEQSIVEQLGDKPENIFSNFSKEPLAVASIGQVHKAEIDGKELAIKIQHQNIDKIAHADLEILKNLVKIHAYFMDIPGLDHTYQQVRQMIEEELDYEKEALAMVQIADNLNDLPHLNIKIPKVYNQFSTKKILASEFCEGKNIGHLEEIKKWNLNLEDLAKRLFELYCKMILTDGFYHADPHPGNILVNKNGEIILLDFGAVAHLTQATKKAIPELIEAIIKKDTESIILALKKMGFLGSDKASKNYIKKLINIFKDFVENEVEFDGLNFQNIKLNSGFSSLSSMIQKVDLSQVSNSLLIPKDYILLNRTLVLLIGNAFHLAPNFNALDVVRPYIKKHILNKEYGFGQMLVKTFKNQITTAISLPNELSQFLKNSNETDLEDQIKGLKIRLKKLYYLGQQLLFSFLLMGFCYFFINQNLIETPWLNNLFWGILVIVSLLFFRSIYKDFKTKDN